MKTLNPMAALPFILLFGCVKNQITPTDVEMHQTEESLPTVYKFNLENDESIIEVISLKSIQAPSGSVVNTRSNAKTNGHFTTQNDNTLTFAAKQNNSGVHGQSRVTGEIFDIKMSSECLEIVGNQAVFSGQITQVDLVPSGAEDFLVVGTYLYWLVEDNGEGNNSESDRYSGQLFFSAEEFGPLCDQLPPGSDCWNPAAIFDTANESDQIQVSD